jgi:hypothetical protein
VRTLARKLQGGGYWGRVLLLTMLLFRAYIPPGFMPADGVPFALQLCPAAIAGMPGQRHHHLKSHADFESCPFGSASGLGPISQHIDFAVAGPARRPLPALENCPLGGRAQPVHQPRGPPTLS